MSQMFLPSLTVVSILCHYMVWFLLLVDTFFYLLYFCCNFFFLEHLVLKIMMSRFGGDEDKSSLHGL